MGPDCRRPPLRRLRGIAPSSPRAGARGTDESCAGCLTPRSRSVVEGLAPKLDILINGSTEVNLARAEQSASVATPVSARGVPGPDAAAEPAAPLEVRRLTPSDVAALMRKAPKRPRAPEVDFSLFVQLNQGLDPDVQQRATSEIERLTRRARWKEHTAAVELPASNVRALHAIDGVSYIEPGQALRDPEPIIGADARPPEAGLRRVDQDVRKHRHGSDVLVGLIDVGGFDFAHEDFVDAAGSTRWVAIWDQGGTTRPSPAETRTSARFDALDYGAEILQSHMQDAMAAAHSRGMAATALEPQSAMVPGSHGTHVASIAAGNRGVARGAHIAGVLVALRPEDTAVSSSFYDSTRIAAAVDYLLALAAELGGADGPLPGVDQHQPRHERPRARHVERHGPVDRQRALDAGPLRVGRRGQRRAGRAALGGRPRLRPGTDPRRRQVRGHGPPSRARLDRRRRRGGGHQRERAGDLVQPAGSDRRRGAPARRRLDRPDQARPRTSGTRCCQRHRPERAQRDVLPGERRQPDLDRALAVLRPGAGRRPLDRPDRRAGSGGYGSRAPSCATAATTPGSSATTRARSPARAGGTGSSRPSSRPAPTRTSA